MAAFAASEEPLRVVRFDVPLLIKPVAAEASSTHPPDKETGEEFSTKNAIDGKPNTRWSSALGEPQWLILDLDDTYNVDKVIIYWGSVYTASYKIETSEDGTNWKEAYSTDTGRGKVGTAVFPLTKAKYIKIYCIKKSEGQGPSRSEGQGFSISEISVYGKKELLLF